MRIPDGPSAQQATGMPKPSSASDTPPNAAAVPGVTLMLHIPSPLTTAVRTSVDSWAIKVSIWQFPSATCLSRSPLSPVYGIVSGSLDRIRSFRSTVLVGAGLYSSRRTPSPSVTQHMRSKCSIGASASSHDSTKSVSASCQSSLLSTDTFCVSRTLVPAWKQYVPASST